jgi:hypothetical protein
MWVRKVNDPQERRDLIAYSQEPDISLDFCPR